VFLWHVGGTVAAIRYAFRDDRMDLRLLIAGAVLPDLIDTPLGLLWFNDLGSVRLFSHSLLFGAAVMVAVVVATRRGRPRKRWMPLAVGILMHLVLDAMWADPETLWWPFLGVDFAASGYGSAGALVRAILTDWRVWVLELAGLAYLSYLARRGNLGSAAERATFRSTGRIGVPIDRR
jgi:membrane-bound metal-dependent hydrolase YbcI (DUF457 family)